MKADTKEIAAYLQGLSTYQQQAVLQLNIRCQETAAAAMVKFLFESAVLSKVHLSLCCMKPTEMSV